MVVVYTNMTDKRAEINNTFEGLGKEVGEFEQYTTSEAKDLKREPSYNKGVVPAKGISTFYLYSSIKQFSTGIRLDNER